MFQNEPFSRGKKKSWTNLADRLLLLFYVLSAVYDQSKLFRCISFKVHFPPFFCIIKINHDLCLESFFFDMFIILRNIQSFTSPFRKIRKWHMCFFIKDCNILISKLIRKHHLSTFLTRSHYGLGNDKPLHFKTHYMIVVLICGGQVTHVFFYQRL